MMKYQDTELWKYLCSISDASVVDITKATLQLAEEVLKHASTSPKDFTLHDSEHAFRVAQRMNDLLKGAPENYLSGPEVGLLLCSAYLHDIGMSPSYSQISSHRNYLLSADRTLLSPSELADFDEYLLQQWDSVTVPVGAESLSADDLYLTDKIVGYYCRLKHNDWSEEWIRSNLGSMAPIATPYPDWTDDLIVLCKSHHEGLQTLKERRFDARVVGSMSTVVNLRYLAAVLRMADVIEFDPERTPSVMLTYRNIDPDSRIYWYKDHEIGFVVQRDSDSLMFSARTPGASVHKAVLDTASQVNVEMSNCSALSHGDFFRRGTIPDSDRDRYVWPWPSTLITDISERDSSFVFIDGAFRPDGARVLELLSGLELYQSPFAAVRELLQNAVDAVKEQVSLERLQRENPESSDLARQLGEIHRIRVTLESEGERYWLRCSDDGVGMTKDIIANHLLVSGSKPTSAVIGLERDCNRHGFSIGRTGTFGIGALSYFMISDRIEIATRRSGEAGDHDHTGWSFATEGLTAFGELSKASRSTKGTEVRLLLKEEDPFELLAPRNSVEYIEDQAQPPTDQVEGQSSLGHAIGAYIRETVRHLPCSLEFRDDTTGSTSENYVLPSGWTAGLTPRPEDSLDRSRPYQEPRHLLRTSEQLEKEKQEVEEGKGRREAALRATRYFGPLDITLSSIPGTARCWLPYFDVGGHASLGLPYPALPHDLESRAEQNFVRPSGKTRVSWHGFLTNDRLPEHSFDHLIEINLTGGAAISVNRLQFRTSITPIAKELAPILKDHTNSFLRYNKDSIYSTLNDSFSGLYPYHLDRHGGDDIHWSMIDGASSTVNWTRCEFPLLSTMTQVDTPRLRRIARDITGYALAMNYGTRSTLHQTVEGGRLVFIDHPSLSESPPLLAICWDDRSQVNNVGIYEMSFPDELVDFCYLSTDAGGFFNSNFEIVAMDGAYKLSDGEVVPEKTLVEMNADSVDRPLARRLLTQNVHRSNDFWNGLRENQPEKV